METMELGQQLVALCKSGKNLEAIDRLFAPDAVSVEAAQSPKVPREMRGTESIREKNRWWFDNHEVHSSEVLGPFPSGDRFAVYYRYDVTNRERRQRYHMDEIAVYSVANDKIVREEFFYPS